MRDTTDLINAFRKVALGVFKAQQPTDVLFGTVTATEPLAVSLMNGVTVSGEAVAAVSGEYAVNDKVAVIQKMGGKLFVVIGVTGVMEG